MKAKMIALLAGVIGAFALAPANAQTPTPSPTPAVMATVAVPAAPTVYFAILPANQTATVFTAFSSALTWASGTAPTPVAGTTVTAVILPNGSSRLTIRIPASH